MKKILAACLALVLVVTTAGCPASWVQDVEQNPQAVVSEIAQVVSTVITTAQLLFGAIAPQLPAATQTTDQALLNQAVAVVEHALTALEDAVQVAIDAKSATVENLGALETAVSTAVDALVATIDAIRGTGADGGTSVSVSQATTSTAYADLKVQQGLLKRIH
jgi:hypothetical protein